MGQTHTRKVEQKSRSARRLCRASCCLFSIRYAAFLLKPGIPIHHSMLPACQMMDRAMRAQKHGDSNPRNCQNMHECNARQLLERAQAVHVGSAMLPCAPGPRPEALTAGARHGESSLARIMMNNIKVDLDTHTQGMLGNASLSETMNKNDDSVGVSITPYAQSASSLFNFARQSARPTN